MKISQDARLTVFQHPMDARHAKIRRPRMNFRRPDAGTPTNGNPAHKICTSNAQYCILLNHLSNQQSRQQWLHQACWLREYQIKLHVTQTYSFKRPLSTWPYISQLHLDLSSICLCTDQDWSYCHINNIWPIKCEFKKMWLNAQSLWTCIMLYW